MAKKMTRTIKTRLGPRDIAEDSILYFPRGLIGIEDKREFVLLQVGEKSPFLLLQCLSDPELGLLVADPYPFLSDYKVKLDNAEKRLLRIENIRQIAVIVTVTIPQGRPAETTLNLSGPIIINTEARLGLQVPQVDSKYPTHFKPVDGPGDRNNTPEGG
ncbi:flagellar assembly protein FliW [Desulfovibrio aminophilus]|uniref:flagellar assembly protein FliW n=1 Tax=Desulfovibrio aminophilus TaxID=81425 RepID=UPI0033957955